MNFLALEADVFARNAPQTLVAGQRGGSAKQIRVVQRERWENGDRQLNVTYGDKESGIAIVYFGIREFFVKEVEVEL